MLQILIRGAAGASKTTVAAVIVKALKENDLVVRCDDPEVADCAESARLSLSLSSLRMQEVPVLVQTATTVDPPRSRISRREEREFVVFDCGLAVLATAIVSLRTDPGKAQPSGLASYMMGISTGRDVNLTYRLYTSSDDKPTTEEAVKLEYHARKSEIEALYAYLRRHDVLSPQDPTGV
jgi:hypothetical protein